MPIEVVEHADSVLYSVGSATYCDVEPNYVHFNWLIR